MAGSPEGAGDGDVVLRRKLEETERRLQSTGLELRAALSKLHEPRGDGGTAGGTVGGPPRGSGGGAGGTRRGDGTKVALCQPCACGHTGMSCMEHAGSSFWRSFVLAYMCRAGIAVFARGRPPQMLLATSQDAVPLPQETTVLLKSASMTRREPCGRP